MLTNLLVDPSYRRRGLGSQIIQAALHTARAQGFRTVMLEARPGSPDITTTGLINMYRGLGFQTVGNSAGSNPMLARQLVPQAPNILPGRRVVASSLIQRAQEDAHMGGTTPPSSPSMGRLRNTPGRIERRNSKEFGPPQQTNRLTRRNSVEMSDATHFGVASFEIGEFKKPLPKGPPSEPAKGRPAWRKHSVYVDKHGNEIFDGSRASMSWLNGFYVWFGTQYATGCTAGGAHSTDFEIDHKSSFYQYLQSNSSKRPVCDGSHHWDAYIARFRDENFTFPVALKSKNENSVVRIYHSNSNLKWMCSSHNGSKSGLHDEDKLYGPDYVEACPGSSCKL